MALTRKFLAALGIEPEKIDEIIEAHTDTVDALKAERDNYKTDAELLPGIQQELDELREAADRNKDNPYKAQYDTLKDEFDQYKADVEAKAIHAKKKAAYKSILKEAGIIEKYIDSIARISDIDSYELETDGKIKNHDSVLEAIKKDHADFVEVKKQEGAQKNNPPGGGGGGSDEPSMAALIAQKHNQSVWGVSPKGDNS